jgi:hypothetical protein
MCSAQNDGRSRFRKSSGGPKAFARHAGRGYTKRRIDPVVEAGCGADFDFLAGASRQP